jgi:putative Holliday junction resolvase
MNLLGIDYGKSKVGLALATGPLASPYKVIKNNNKLFNQLEEIIKSENINKIIVGLSENEIAEDQKAFTEELKSKLNIEVILQDETLTTRDAQYLSREAGINRSKRKRLEDAFAATLILQSHLDNTTP